MSILKKLHGSILVGVAFLLTGTRPAVTGVLPPARDNTKEGASIGASLGTNSFDLYAAAEGDKSGGDKSGGNKGGGSGDDGSGGAGGGDGDNGGGGG